MKHSHPATMEERKTLKVKLGTRRQITLPATTLKHLGISAGAELEVVENKHVIVLVPRKKRIPKDQHWYYTEEWQRKMHEAFEDLKRGRVAGPFGSTQELIKDLRS